jgi:Heparinase II/III-like protein
MPAGRRSHGLRNFQSAPCTQPFRKVHRPARVCSTIVRLPLIAFVSLSILSPISSVAAPVPFKELSPERVAAIAGMLPAGPAGFGKPITDRDFWKNPETLARTDDAVRRATPLLDKEFPAWSDELYLDFSKTGRRGPAEAMLRSREAWLVPLVTAECIENQGRFIPAIHRTLEAFLAQPTWTLPAHDRSLDNFHRRKYTVDLRAAETSADLAQTLWLLGGRIDPDLRARMLAALEQRIFTPVRASLQSHKDHWWLGEKSDPVKNNWNAVCLAGVIGAARTILPDRDDRAVFIAAGEHYTQYFINGFTDDGYCDEGPGYWVYGFGDFVGLREIIADATGGRIDLFDNPKTLRMALYGKRIGFPGGDVPPFADCRTNSRIHPQLIGYCDRVFGLTTNTRASGPGLRGLSRMFAGETPAKRKASTPPADESLRSYFDKVGVLLCRPGEPSAGRLSAAIKAGGNGSHSHNDIGSFVISLDGQQPVGDPGGPHAYDSETFGPKRYEKNILNSFGHPVPVVDGQLQVDATTVKPKVLESLFQPEWDRITIDMTPAYQVPSLKQLTRTMTYSRRETGRIGIDDHVVFTKPSAFELGLTTRWKATRTGESTLEFSHEGKTLVAEITTPDGFDLTETQIEELAAPVFTRLGIKLRKPVTEATVRVVFQVKQP